MNNRIEKYAEEAGFGWDDKYHWYVGSRQLEKFAELIVRDAMDYASRNWEHGHLLAEDLRVYFGIEK